MGLIQMESVEAAIDALTVRSLCYVLRNVLVIAFQIRALSSNLGFRF